MERFYWSRCTDKDRRPVWRIWDMKRGDHPIANCYDVDDAQKIVDALNAAK